MELLNNLLDKTEVKHWEKLIIDAKKVLDYFDGSLDAGYMAGVRMPDVLEDSENLRSLLKQYKDGCRTNALFLDLLQFIKDADL